jgi:hypothetical protein
MKRGNSIMSEGCPKMRFLPSKAVLASTDSAGEPFFYSEGKAVGDYGREHTGRDVCAFDRRCCTKISGE